MSRDPLLAAIRRELIAERDEVDKDPRWQALLDGTITDSERAELEALAKTSEEARVRFELMRPLDPEVSAAIFQKTQALLRAKASPARQKSERAWWKSRGTAAFAALMAIAAATTLFLARIPSDPIEGIASFDAEVTNSQKELRSSKHGPPREVFVFMRNTRSEILVEIRAEHDIAPPVVFEVLSVAGSGRSLVKHQAEASAVGTWKVQIEVDALPPDTTNLIFAIGRSKEVKDGVAEIIGSGSDEVIDSKTVVFRKVPILLKEPKDLH
jgi:hypothetical protein